MEELRWKFNQKVELSQEDAAASTRLDTVAFEGIDDGLEWAPSEWLLRGFAGEELVTQLAILDRQIKVGEQQVRVGGIGGVATDPRWRKRGFAEKSMIEAARLMRDEFKVEFGMLFCLDDMLAYYSRLGWQQIFTPVRIEQRGGTMVLPLYAMVIPLTGRDWPLGAVDLCGLPW